MRDSDNIIIFTEEELSPRRSGESKRKRQKINKIPVDEFADEASSFYHKMVNIFGNLKNEKKGCFLEEIVINAEVSGSGSIGFLGTGVEAGIRGSVQFKLKFNH